MITIFPIIPGNGKAISPIKSTTSTPINTGRIFMDASEIEAKSSMGVSKLSELLKAITTKKV